MGNAQPTTTQRLDLKPGAAAVYRVDGRLLAWGDFAHCNPDEIMHNILALASELRRHPRWWGISKTFRSDVRRLEETVDWERVQREVRDIYREYWLVVGDDGSLAPFDDNGPKSERSNALEPKAPTETRNNGHTNGHTPAPPAPNGALDILWDALPPRVAERLAQPLDQTLVSYRKGRGGRTVPYLEGHAVIAHANEVFGHGGWGYEVVGDVVCRAAGVDGGTGEVKQTQFYCATVRVTVPGVPPRADVGCQPVADDTVDGHDTAYKGAVTDALKRALRSFGTQFGNGLYGDGVEDTITPSLKDSLAALASLQGLTADRLREAVRKKTGKELDSLPASELAPLVLSMIKKLPASSPDGSASS